jgi:hypothetical protein
MWNEAFHGCFMLQEGAAVINQPTNQPTSFLKQYVWAPNSPTIKAGTVHIAFRPATSTTAEQLTYWIRPVSSLPRADKMPCYSVHLVLRPTIVININNN